MFNEYILQGVVMHQYAMILSLLLAVRQACDHPFLLLSRAKDVLQRQEEEVVQKALTTDIIERIYEVAFQGKKEVEAYAESVLRELKEKTVEDLICPVKDGCAKLGLDLQFIDSSQTGVYILFTLFL
jgi:singapore isolate B (sub-type 7) whole genome shotgun sequence assembly, scaffold_14